MKKLFTIITAVILTATVWSQSPQKLSYQAVIRNTSNALITSRAVGVKISILQGISTGTSVYVETQTPTSNANGLISIEIGGGTVVSGNFTSINWANGPYFIKTETDPAGSTSYTITGTSQLLSVPYSLFAKTAESITGSITETDPIFVAWNKSTGISITASQISDFQTSVTNNSAMLANTAKNSYPSADATKLAGIAAGAEVNVNADWNATSGDTQILNKPTTDGSETKVTAGTNVTVTGTGTTASPYVLNSSASGSGINGTAVGDILYWNGTAWVILPRGTNSQVLTINSSNIPSWQNSSATTFLAPTATALAATNVQGFSVKLNGIVNAHGTETSGEFEVSLTSIYDYSSWKNLGLFDVSGTSDVAVSATITRNQIILEPGITYHYRISASNAVLDTYSNDMTFTMPFSAPLVTTSNTDWITDTSAYVVSEVHHNGGASVTARGVCWSTSPNPTTALSTKTSNGTGTGGFTSDITGITTRTNYYVRAYATNSIGTAYGNELIFTTGIGTSYLGGKIAYIFRPGDPGYVAGQTHGLIVAPSDQDTNIQWYNGSYTSTGATATALGTGNANTNSIVASQGAGSYAAKLCSNLVLNGYSDWYLPSKDEWALCGFVVSYEDDYWSSSEHGNINYAWTDDWGYALKNTKYHVRAFRTF